MIYQMKSGLRRPEARLRAHGDACPGARPATGAVRLLWLDEGHDQLQRSEGQLTEGADHIRMHIGSLRFREI